jgi:hypothetical protein
MTLSHYPNGERVIHNPDQAKIIHPEFQIGDENLIHMPPLDVPPHGAAAAAVHAPVHPAVGSAARIDPAAPGAAIDDHVLFGPNQ